MKLDNKSDTHNNGESDGNNQVEGESEAAMNQMEEEILEVAQALNSINNITGPVNENAEELEDDEVAALVDKMESINKALDSLEERSDNIVDELRKILAENKKARDEIQQEGNSSV
ncbi:hypothetical protein FHG87_011071 [Trinorchestia longiramus]|nr:hypothetical protein FHG87_011071 [Trinorchestia longiramus]